MSSTTIGSVTSRIRGLMKAERQDSFLTDKFIYSLFKKHAALTVKRLDEKGKLVKFSSVFETLDYVELVECDKIEAGCTGLKSYSTFRKTKLPMPMFTEGAMGPMVNSITSIDGGTACQIIRNVDLYNYMSRQNTFKYNKTKYCWYLNDRLYFANVDWPACRIEGLFEDDISVFKCNYDDKCKPRQEQSLNLPDYILSEVEANMLKDLGFELKVPEDDMHDNRNNLR